FPRARRCGVWRFSSNVMFVLLFVGVVSAVWAQTTSTAITGVVIDSTGSVVPGATVTLTRIATGETRTATTNSEGIYSVPLIEPGEYRVHVELTGFKSTTISNVNVLLQQRARVDVKLEVGQLTQEVQVVAEARL